MGYKKPPNSGQFKKGISGNPAGRKPKLIRAVSSGQLCDDVLALMETPRRITENGKTREIPYILALLEKMMDGALKKDFRARNQLLPLYMQMLNWHQNKDPELFLQIADLERVVRQTEKWGDRTVIRELNKRRRKTKPRL